MNKLFYGDNLEVLRDEIPYLGGASINRPKCKDEMGGKDGRSL